MFVLQYLVLWLSGNEIDLPRIVQMGVGRIVGSERHVGHRNLVDIVRLCTLAQVGARS